MLCRFIEYLVELAFELNQLLVGGRDTVVPVTREERWHNLILATHHDQGRLNKVDGVGAVVGGGKCHLLSHAERELGVIVRISAVFIAHCLGRRGFRTQRVANLNQVSARQRWDAHLGTVRYFLEHARVESSHVLERQTLVNRRLCFALDIGHGFRGNRFALFTTAVGVEKSATAIGDDAVDTAWVLDAVEVHGKTAHGVAEQEGLRARVLRLGLFDEHVQVIDKRVEIIDVATSNWSAFNLARVAVTAVVETVDVVAGIQ